MAESSNFTIVVPPGLRERLERLRDLLSSGEIRPSLGAVLKEAARRGAEQIETERAPKASQG